MSEDSIWYTGFNAEEVIEWAKSKNEEKLVMFNGELTLFLPDHRLILSRGDILDYSYPDDRVPHGIITVRKRKYMWYNDYE